jgi:hypothetical protein
MKKISTVAAERIGKLAAQRLTVCRPSFASPGTRRSVLQWLALPIPMHSLPKSRGASRALRLAEMVIVFFIYFQETSGSPRFPIGILPGWFG